MEELSYYATAISFATIIVTWFGFAGTFLRHKKPETSPDAVKAPKSWVGLVLQGVGFAVVWSVRRKPFMAPIIEGQYAINITLQVIAVILATVSVWLAMSAIKELGKQWSLQARLIEDHQLVTTGVYQIVRHPIYTAMLGMMLATGIAFSNWIAIIAAVAIFLVGTRIRTNLEEGLLYHAFGEEFEMWRAKVPGLIPFLKI